MSEITLGILGGGQLGSMLSIAAKKLNIKTIIYCDDQDAPAQKFCDQFSYIFQKSKKQNLEPGFQNFQISVPKYVFWCLRTFWGVQKIVDSFTIFLFFYICWLIRDKS